MITLPPHRTTPTPKAPRFAGQGNGPSKDAPLYPSLGSSSWKDLFKKRASETATQTSKQDASFSLGELLPEEHLVPRKNKSTPKRSNTLQSIQSNQSTPSTSSQTTLRNPRTYIAQEIPRGEFNSYADFKQERNKARFNQAQLVVMAALGIAAIAFPPLWAGVAAAGTANPSTYTYVFKALKYTFDLTANLADNRVALPKFKQKISSAAKKMNDWTQKTIDPLRKIPRFQPHLRFLENLNDTFQEFAQKIQTQNLEECLQECLNFETQTYQLLQKHLINTNKKETYTFQTHLRKYDKYLNALPENLSQISEVNRLQLEELVNKAKQSSIPELVEWANNPDNLAYNVARLKIMDGTA